MAKLIKTTAEHARALEELEQLVAESPLPGTPEADRLELLGVLIDEFEAAQAPERKPDPIEAIRFRMEQHGLTPRDLVPLLGSRSRVSEILAGRRALTLPMIRGLNRTLGIPAESLISEPGPVPIPEVPWDRFPVKEMQKRGWIARAEESKEDVTDRK